MRALRAQMNPHFIFNCLGSINRYIVKSDTKTASNYLTKFSKLIRLILDNSSSDHISLEAEIQTLQLYLDMESLRFDHAFEYEIQKEDNVDECNLQLPSMLIQPYVENAIWHGLLQKSEKGKLWVRFKKINDRLLQAEIEDNGIGRKKAAVLKSKELIKHKSYGMQISSDRIEIINHLYRLKNSVSIHDLVDDNGDAAGTKIILQIPVS
jgi:sensor histidine kinase YesM